MSKMNRRNVLLGLGTAAAGSGIVFGSGAFTQLEADRTVDIDVEEDAAGQIQLTPGGVDSGAFVEGNSDSSGDRQISLEQEGILEGARVELGEFNGDELAGESQGILQVNSDIERESNLEVTIDVTTVDSDTLFESFEVATTDESSTSVSVVLEDPSENEAETAVQFGFSYEVADDAGGDSDFNDVAGISITAEPTPDGVGDEAFNPT